MDNKYGYCKGIDRKTGRAVEGYFAVIPFCTYCFKEDYEAHPDNDREYVVHWRPTDWGLPNAPIITEIERGSAKRYIGEDKNGRRVFEDDLVKFVCEGRTKPIEISVRIFFGDWIPHKQRKPDWDLTMWDITRNLWLCDGELVEEGEDD